jgi:hypothetical protein
MNFRPDKEYEKRGDIVFLSEIITKAKFLGNQHNTINIVLPWDILSYPQE